MIPEIKRLIVLRRRKYRLMMASVMSLCWLVALLIGALSGALFGLVATAIGCAISAGLCVRFCVLAGKPKGGRIRDYARPATLIGLIGAAILFVGSFTGLTTGFGSEVYWGPILSLMCLTMPMFLLRQDSDYSEDVNAEFYCRSAGPVSLESDDETYAFYVGEARFPVVKFTAIDRTLQSLEWAVIDHTLKGAFILQIRNKEGSVLYSRGGGRLPF